jgi:HEAT repeat protein
VNQTQKWISWITSSDKKKWKKATLALGGLSYDSDVDVPCLISALDSDVDDVVFWCVGALGSLGDRSIDAIDRLIALTDSEYLGVRQASIYALSKIAPDRTDLNDLFVRKLSDPSEFVVCSLLCAECIYKNE